MLHNDSRVVKLLESVQEMIGESLAVVAVIMLMTYILYVERIKK